VADAVFIRAVACSAGGNLLQLMGIRRRLKAKRTYQVVQAPLSRAANVHAWALSDGVQALQHLSLKPIEAQDMKALRLQLISCLRKAQQCKWSHLDL